MEVIKRGANSTKYSNDSNPSIRNANNFFSNSWEY